MAELVAKKYAKALFEVASDEKKHDVVGQELLFLRECLEDEPMLYQVLENPLIITDNKKEILNSILKENVSREVLNFLHVIIDKKREKYIGSIIEEYIALTNEAENIMEAVAVTAVPLDNEMLVKLQKTLSKSLGKNVQLTNEIEAEVVGGVFLKVGDKTIDGTIKNRLEQIQNQILQVKC